MSPRTKDWIYRLVPMPVLQQVLPRFTSSRTPFLPHILASRVIFVHVPKAAGTSVATAVYVRPDGGHRSIAEYTAYDAQKTQEFFKCAFVRNPWDRLLSAYTYLMQNAETNPRDQEFARRLLRDTGDFEAFVERLAHRGYREQVVHYDHFRPQTHWVCLPGRREHRMDFVGRFENLQHDLDALLIQLDRLPASVRHREAERAGVADRPDGHIRPSTHAPYRAAYTDRTRQIVADVYAHDIELFDYSF